jgi:hypothetical protein
MNKDILLLFDPPYILHPDDALSQNDTIGRYYRIDNESLVKCENCGKPLEPLYYIILGIPPSPLMVDALLCKSIDDEKEIEKLVTSNIQDKLKYFNIETNTTGSSLSKT